MNLVRTLVLTTILLGWIGSVQAQNPNLITPANGCTFTASSMFNNPPSRGRAANVAREVYQMRWESNNEKSGAWLTISWAKVQSIKEIWIMTKSKPYDIVLEPDQRDGKYTLPKLVKLTFSNGMTVETELRPVDFFQVIELPAVVETDQLTLTIEQVWDTERESNTGICKVKAFGMEHLSSFRLNTFDMFDVRDGHAVQSAKIEVINKGDIVSGAKLEIRQKGKLFGSIDLDELPANSVSTQQLWIPIVHQESVVTCSIVFGEKRFLHEDSLILHSYPKNYFDGGELDILAMNHNDLGWLDTQTITADYRSDVLIAPALDLMATDSSFKYTMESVEYLKEFFIRHPERKQELIRRIREGRFAYGASYVQNLQVQVGYEKLIRQFYYGKRWFKENFPGCDTRFYINTDVPGFTYQMPQILKKAGIDYIIQGRFPWGFYYWQGLDGTTIPMFAFRYGSDSRLLNPKNNTGYLKFLNEREYYYKPRQLPKMVLYDFNSDYLPPCPDLLPFVAQQNHSMAKFALQWNQEVGSDSNALITPPRICFAEPNSILRRFFGQGELNIETLKGDWPMSWAYYDEPGHREGLLSGRRGHDALVKAEVLFVNLNQLDSAILYPQQQLDRGWLANCWPDHGWGGNRGVIGDQVCVDSYAQSQRIGDSLVREGEWRLLQLLPPGTANEIPIVVFNACNWQRTDLVTCTIRYPAHWKGLEIRDSKHRLIPAEAMEHLPQKHVIVVGFYAQNVPSIGYQRYYATESVTFPEFPKPFAGDSIENDRIKVKFGKGGISSLFDKGKRQELLRTEKFFGGEVIQLEAPTVAWENQEPVTMKDFDRTSNHEVKTIRSEESSIRYMIEKEAIMNNFILKERFILNKLSNEVIVEADVVDWSGEKARELRVVFPVNIDPPFDATYDVPFGRVEVNRDNIDYSYLPDNYECQFVADRYGRKELPFREAIHWVDLSTGRYKGFGCLFASDMSVHLLRDETENPVSYPVLQHVLLSTRESFGWNPKYSFTQKGSHSYRMALYPHDGNWRFAYKSGMGFNQPLTALAGKVEGVHTKLNEEGSFLEVEPANIVVTTIKRAEDGKGTIVRLYEAEGRFSKVKIVGLKPFAKGMITDLLEYDQQEIPVHKSGEIEFSIKPYEIITLRLTY